MKRNRDFEKEKEILKRQQKHTENTEENNFSYEMGNEKIESLYVTREMAEDKEMDEKIRQDLIRAADEAEKKGIWEEDPEEADGNHPEKGTSPCPARPEDQLSAEDQEALRLGRELLHTPKKKNPTILSKILKGITRAAVVALGVFVLSMSSEANRVKLLSMWNSVIGEELRIDFENEDNRIQDNQIKQEMDTDIKNKLGIQPVQLLYLPKGMQYRNYIIDENAGVVSIFYTYNNSTIICEIFNKKNETSQNQRFDGNVIENVKLSPQEINVDIYKINNEDEESFAASFEYNNAFYVIWGKMPFKEFEEMIKKIKV